MKIAYVGNHQPNQAPEDRHSTECHIAQALTKLGHDVTPVQEDVPDNWKHLAHLWLPSGEQIVDFDVLLWTRTGWAWHLLNTTEQEMHQCMRRMLGGCKQAGIPTVGVHLDRWWGLARQKDIYTQPYFQVEHLFTADGGHDAEWRAAGVNHHWMPPAVSEFECVPGTYRPEYAADVAFIGSWQGYHPEWQHRFDLVEHLRQRGARFWPEPGQVVRGQKLRDVIASTKVLVGDSCLVGGITHYCSDRIPETLGRGGLLVHPQVEGVTDGTLYNGSAEWTPARMVASPLDFEKHTHLATWPLGHWDALDLAIDQLLTDPLGVDIRGEISAAGRAHVLANHTYSVRMKEVLETVANA